MQYHTTTYGPDEIAFRKALWKEISEASNNKIHQVLFIVHTLQNLDGVISKVLGEKTIKNFSKNKKASSGSITFYVQTEHIRSPDFTEGVILAPFISPALLAKAFTDSRAADVVYVPWAESELQAYAARNPASLPL